MKTIFTIIFFSYFFLGCGWIVGSDSDLSFCVAQSKAKEENRTTPSSVFAAPNEKKPSEKINNLVNKFVICGTTLL